MTCAVVGRDEANDEVKVNVLHAMGAWLRHAVNLPASVGKRLADSLKEKDALKAAALSATLQVNSIASPVMMYSSVG